AAIILFKWIGPNRGILKKIILKDRTTTELGYTSNDEREELIGQTGITVSMLRPAGIMETETERLDVVSEGSFIEAGVPRSEEHTSELQSRFDLVCRLLLEKKNNIL